MLSIGDTQAQIFAKQMQAQFESVCVAMLRDTYPEVTAKHRDEKLLELVRYAIERAQGRGLLVEADWERWLHLMMRLGPRFDEDPHQVQVNTILTDRSIDPSLQLDAIENLLATAATPVESTDQ